MEDEFCIEHFHNKFSGKKTRLIRLKPNDPTFARLEATFQDGWKHPKKPKFTVSAIYRVLSPRESLEPYLIYRKSVESCLSFSAPTAGNEALLFHGTNRACLLGEKGDNVRLCTLSECFLCNIIRGSFDISKCGQKSGFKRFGRGIYTTTCSSKADDYTVNVSVDAVCRVMLVNRVVVGHPLRKRWNDTTLIQPPAGYHSIIGEPGGHLNYHETVVYCNEAIRPAFLVVYGPPLPKPAHKFRTMVSTLFKTPISS